MFQARHLTALALIAVLLIPLAAEPVGAMPQDAAGAVANGVAWLNAHANAGGGWGDPAGSGLRDTAVAAKALRSQGSVGSAYTAGLAVLANAVPVVNDYQARRAAVLARDGQDVSALITGLLDSQNDNWSGTGVPNAPEGGWGIAAGYASDVPDTALVLDAIHAAGLTGGLFVGGESVAAGQTDNFHYTVPSGATVLRMIFNPLSGQIQVRVKAGTPPTLADPYYTLTGPASLGGLSLQAGMYYIRVDGVAANSTYSVRVSYIANGFDTDSLLPPLSYLTAAQRGDGGWGLAVGADESNVALTAGTVLTLVDYSAYYNVGTARANGVARLVAQQNGDGGWGSPTSTAYETALAYYALERAGSQAFNQAAAENYLLSHQSGDGSWNGLAYDTAVAVLALGNQFIGLPAAPASLTITAAGTGITLDWSPVATTRGGDSLTVDHYNIYRSTSPYFTVTGTTSPYASTADLTFPDAGVLGHPEANYFYVVAAVGAAGTIGDPSLRAGKFEFRLVPGR